MASAPFSFLRTLVSVVFVAAAMTASAQAQNYGDGFDPNGDANIYAMIRQPDGKIIVGGSFTHFEPDRYGNTVTRERIARINRDGSIDTTFTTYTDGDISAMALQPDGKILIAGKFSYVGNGEGASRTVVGRTGIARLNADGSVDTSFVQVNPIGFGAPPYLHYPQAIIRAVAVQTDGRILIGGAFGSLQPDGSAAPITRTRLARLNADGTVDTTFDVAANNVVLALLVEPDGDIVVGGGFTTIRPHGATATVTRNRIARLTSAGAIDTGLVASLDNRVLALARQADGKILLGGEFTSITMPGASAVDAGFIARLNEDGSRDSSFTPSTNGAVESLAIQADGRLLVGGRFTWVRSGNSSSIAVYTYLARFFANGVLDTDFSPGANAPVTASIVQPDTTIVVAGYFTGLSSGSGSTARRGRLARIHADGTLDIAFRTAGSGSVLTIEQESGGNLLVAGSFGSVGGVSRYNMARIAPTGDVAAGFAPELNGNVFATRVLSDGKILIAGSFTRVNGVTQRYLARLNADGTLDTAYKPSPNAVVYALALQSDGKVIIGGNFTTLQPDTSKDAFTRRYIARLNADGTVDEGFDPSANLTVNSIVVLSDGKIVIGGDFYTLQPNGARRAESYFYIARLNADGTADETFTPRPNAAVSRVRLQSDGKFIISGSFTSLFPGKGDTAVERRYVARLNADGTVDTAFDTGPNAPVFNVEQYPDGRYLIHGSFTMFKPAGSETWTDQSFLAWLGTDGRLDTTRTLAPDLSPSMTAVLPDGTTYIGGSFSRLTGAGGVVTPVNELLLRILPTGAIDTTFTLGPGSGAIGYVSALATQVGGRLYAGGSFSGFGGARNANLARFYPDGAADNNFNSQSNGAVHAIVALETSEDEEEDGGPVAWLETDGEYRAAFDRTGSVQISGSVYALAVQSDGKILVAGEFTDGIGTSVGNLARLNTDGTIDESFHPEPNQAVQTVAVQSDGKIIIGGTFTKIGETTISNLARLQPNGTVDTAWKPTPNGTVLDILPLSDGNILVGGLFTNFKPNDATTTVSRPYAARIKPDGTVDTDFNAEPNGGVNRMALQTDGKIVLAGAFTSVKGKAREFLARVDNRGALDTAFYPKPNNAVERLVLTSSGVMVVAGQFSNFEPNDAGTFVNRTAVARINADGTVESTFQPIPNNLIEDIGITSNGSIILTGAFTAFQLEEGGTVVRRNHIARFNADGTIDALFNPNANGIINAVTVRSDDSMIIGGAFNQLRASARAIVGGAFTEISESPMPHLARLNDDGSIDSFYTPRPDAPVHALAEQSDGALLVGGEFATIAGTEQPWLARLDALGGIDLTFEPALDGAVLAIVVQADDRILVGGEFTTVDGAAHVGLARLLASGAVDASFSASVDGEVSGIAVQSDGRILIAGDFTQVNGTARPYIARLAADGTLDASFDPEFDGRIHTLAVQADDRILVGGAFTQVDGQDQAHVARLLANGSHDAAFTIEADGDVRSLLILTDGRVVAGGAFRTYAGRRTLMLARTANPTPAAQSATLSGDLATFTWTSSGSSPTFSAVEIATSADGRTWTNAGDAIRLSTGEWRLGGLTGFSATALNHVRARAVQTSNAHGSVGRFEMAWAFYGSTPAGPAALLNSGGALAGWTGGYGDSGDPDDGDGSGDGSGGDGSGGSGGDGDGSGGDGSGGTGGGSSTQQGNHLINLSIRAWPADGQPFIAGLVLTGQDEAQVLMRGVGPGLTRFGVDPVMTEPRMTLFDRSGNVLSRAASWTGDASVAATAASVGAFTLDPDSDDSAVVRTLPPGAYTIHVDAGQGLNGIALGEVYFAGESGGLANFSARAPAGAGTAACIAGFVVGGDQPRRLLIRGVGPALTRFGVADAVPDTMLRVFNADGEVIVTNDNWQQQTNGSTAVEVSSAAAAVSAFSLPLNGKDAAVVIQLPPGSYTVHVGGAVAGTVLAEIYEVP